MIRYNHNTDKVYYVKRSTYIIALEDTPYIKIGSTIDIDQRINQIQSSSPFKVKLLYITKNISENKMKDIFNEYHYRNEWFLLSEKAKSIIESLKALAGE